MSALPSTLRRTNATPAPRRPPLRRPSLRVVPEPRHTARFVLLTLVVAIAGIIGVVSLSALAAEAAFEARALQDEVDELSLRYDELTAEVSALETPERIREVAGRDIGMVRATEPGFLVADRFPRPAAATLDPGELTDRVKPVLDE